MLDNIRKSANSLVMRVLLSLIALAFIWWGIKDVLQPTNNFDLITFSKAQNITESEFLTAKANEINAVQKQMATTFSEEEIAQLNFDNIIIKKLVTDRILNYLISYYDLDISDERVGKLVKQSPVFKNEHDVFDIEIFKNYFKNSYVNEAAYLQEFKEKNLKNILINIFLKSFNPPQDMVKNIINYMAEVRKTQLIEIDLSYKAKNFIFPVVTNEQLKDFYQKNLKLFEIPEKRKFSYVKIFNKNLEKKINITPEEIANFYEENKEELVGKDFEQAKKEIYDLLQEQKIDALNMELAKNLEDAVAAGLNLVEIAEKYELPLQNVDYMSYDELLSDKIIAENVDSVFDLAESELSYPIESADKNSLILVELKSIEPVKIPEFDNIKSLVNAAWQEKYLSEYNFKNLQQIAKNYTVSDKQQLEHKYLGIKISNHNFTRAEISENTIFPPKLLLSLFENKIGENSVVIQEGNKAYFFHIYSTTQNKQIVSNINEQNISESLKNSLVEELIIYTIQINDMKINK